MISTLKQAATENTQLRAFLRNAKHIHAVYSMLSETTLRSEKMKEVFFEPFQKMILERITSHSAQLIQRVLTAPLYKGEAKNLLEKICQAIYKCYIEETKHVAIITISSRNLKKLETTREKFLKYAHECISSVKDVVAIDLYDDDPKIITLRFMLIETL